MSNTAKLILGDDRPSQISTFLGDAASKQAETGESVITPSNELSVSAQSWRREWTTTSATNWNDASRLIPIRWSKGNDVVQRMSNYCLAGVTGVHCADAIFYLPELCTNTTVE
jgi:hypothetical protein